MIYKFRIISDENDLFYRVIEISDDSTFLAFHKAILAACNFEDSEMTSFFVSNADWDKGQEITLVDMGDMGENSPLAMEQCILSDFVGEKDDHIIYQFDFFNDRALFCILTDVIEPKAKIQYPICSHSTGNPPLQKMNDCEEDFNELFDETGLDDEDDIFAGDDTFEGDGFGSEFGNDFGGGDFGNDYDY